MVIYTASPAGITSALAAAQAGKDVLLIEPLEYIGGAIANGGLVMSDLGNPKTVGGLSREFFDRVHSYYVQTYGKDSRQVRIAAKMGLPGANLEPRVAQLIFESWLKEQPRIRVVRGRQLDSVMKDGATIRSITCVGTANPELHETFQGKVFIDASYTGDLLARAEVAYNIGREGKEQYNESLAPSGADDSIQAYNYRVTLTDVASNRVSIEKPADYDPSAYLRFLPPMRTEPVRLWNVFKTDWWALPNGKMDANIADMPGINYGYPQADFASRRQLQQKQRAYTMGFLYFLQNDSQVPEVIRQGAREWGLPKDEFTDNGNFPREIYVREGRRMIGEYVMRQSDAVKDRTKPDGIALGSYSIDIHATGMMLAKNGQPLYAGQVFTPVKPYEIAYRALLPRREQAANLLVPVCLSATHVAYGSIRMEPVYMMLGQASGVAAAMAADSGSAVQDIDSNELRKALRAQRAIVSLPGELNAQFTWEPVNPAPGQPVQFSIMPQAADVKLERCLWDFDGDGTIDSTESSPAVIFTTPKATLVSLMLEGADGTRSLPVQKLVSVGEAAARDVSLDSEDTAHVVLKGLERSISQQPYYGEYFCHDGNAAKGKRSATYTPELTAAGVYRVYASTVAAGGGRATNTLVRITDDGGTNELRIDQSRAPNPFQLIPLGEFRFTPGQTGAVSLNNDQSDGYVICDLVQWIWVRP